MMFGLAVPPRHVGVPSDRTPSRARASGEEDCTRLQSERRSQHLSPDQADQYDTYWRFDVVGSDTGTRYRIRRGTVMNIEELTGDGYVARRWCFAPEGSLAIGDVMLAQKIALETFELDALGPVLS
jgi:hypothetical protein